jgi:formamidopyrimidine-DNA glycosylase
MMSNGNVVFLGSIYGTIRYYESEETLPKKRYLDITFADGTHLVVTITFFGTIRAHTPEEIREQKHAEFERDALDPSAPDFSWDGFSRMLSSNPEVEQLSAKKLVTSCLPTYIGGIGNGYLQGILYRAGIHPKRKIRTLSEPEKREYFQAIAAEVRNGIRQGGRTGELDLYGNPGGYTPPVGKHNVGAPCPACGTEIEKLTFEGGACYVCPGCQPL